MDDLYARLKPSLPALAAVDRAALRRELFGGTTATAPHALRGTTVRLSGRPAHSRRRLVTVATTVLGVLGLSGLLVATRDGAPGGTGAGDTVPPVTVPGVAAADQMVPRLLLDAPGWSLTRVYDVPGASVGRGRGVTIAPAGTFPDGPWASIDATNGSTDLDGTVPPFPESTILAVGAQDIGVTRLDRITQAAWEGPDGVSYGLAGWDLDDATARQIAASTTFDGLDSVNVTPPAGWEIVAPDVAALLDRSVEYEFTDGTPPVPVTTTASAGDQPLAVGRVLTSRLYFGAESALRSRVSPERAVERSVGGETVYVEHADDQFTRIHVLRDSWVWEVDVQGVDSVDDALALFAQLRVVDEATWTATLPDDAVAAAQRPGVLAALLDRVPVPAGFSPDAITGGGTTDRYQLVAQVSGAVACAWLDQWFSAQDAGDATGQQAAADALATSRTWPMLIEIADQGGWSAAVWEWADAVNGGPGVGTGGGWMPPDRDLAASGLGCSS